jgi:hypothetical protein
MINRRFPIATNSTKIPIAEDPLDLEFFYNSMYAKIIMPNNANIDKITTIKTFYK